MRARCALLGRQPRLGQIQAARRASTRARPSTAPPSRRLGNWRSCRACRSTGAPRRPSACPAWESWCRRESARPRRSGIMARTRRHTGAAVHGASRDEMLKGLIGARIADARQHRAHRLAPTVAQQPEQIAPERAPLRDVAEAVLERLEPRLNRSSHAGALRGSTARQRTEIEEQVQVLYLNSVADLRANPGI